MKGITLPISFLHDPLYAAIRLVALYLRDGHNLPRSNQLFSNTLRFQLYSGLRDVTNLIPVAAISRRCVIIVTILTAGVPILVTFNYPPTPLVTKFYSIGSLGR